MSLDPFMIRAHVPHWEASVADYRAASDETRRAHPERRTEVYGASAAEILDLYEPPGRRPSGGWPIHIFIHGGYWRSFSKDDYAFVADAITAAGAIAVVVDYDFMPAARMDRLVEQVRRAAAWVATKAESLGGNAQRISASGHSAGAHLACYLVARSPREREMPPQSVRSVLLVSGLYDLAPIAESFLQPELHLTAAEVAAWSPLSARFRNEAQVTMLVGADETEPFHAQAAALRASLEAQGSTATLATLPDADHMTIVRDLGRPASVCAAHLRRLIEAS